MDAQLLAKYDIVCIEKLEHILEALRVYGEVSLQADKSSWSCQLQLYSSYTQRTAVGHTSYEAALACLCETLQLLEKQEETLHQQLRQMLE